MTLSEPKTDFDVWNGKQWVTDTDAQKVALISHAKDEKEQRLKEANNTLMYLQDAVDVGLASDEEIAALQGWKKYRVLLNRVDISTVPDIHWPKQPK